MTLRELGDARFAATLAAKDITTAIGQVQQGVVATARTPALAKVLSDHGSCTLQFGGSAPFLTGHLDIMSRDGAVHCSSLPGASGQPCQGAAWLPGSQRAPLTAGPVTDARTGGGTSLEWRVPLPDTPASSMISS